MLKERGHTLLCYFLYLAAWNLDVVAAALTAILDCEDKNHTLEKDFIIDILIYK